MKINTKKLILLSIFSLLILTGLTSIYVYISQPKRSGLIKISGLKDKVIVHFDKYGRPHVFANNTHDLVFTHGYLVAQDRLFQLDITRRAAKGELSEILGKKGLLRDKFVRDIGLIDIAKNELKNSSKQSIKILNYYSKGINAYIEKYRHELPIEFRVLNYKPKPWKPIDSILIVKQIAEVTDTS